PLHSSSFPYTTLFRSRLFFPFRKRRERLLTQELFHDQLALANRQSHFAVDEIVVESNSGRVLARVAVKDTAQARPVHRAQTHRARLATRVKIAIVQLESLDP